MHACMPHGPGSRAQFRLSISSINQSINQSPRPRPQQSTVNYPSPSLMKSAISGDGILHLRPPPRPAPRCAVGFLPSTNLYLLLSVKQASFPSSTTPHHETQNTQTTNKQYKRGGTLHDSPILCPTWSAHIAHILHPTLICHVIARRWRWRWRWRGADLIWMD